VRLEISQSTLTQACGCPEPWHAEGRKRAKGESDNTWEEDVVVGVDAVVGEAVHRMMTGRIR